MGDSSVPANYDYSAETVADDVKGVLDSLNINETYVFGHDKGTGVTAALTAKYRSLVKRVGFAEYVLPGYEYEAFFGPSPTWKLYSNWQLAFFSIQDCGAILHPRSREPNAFLVLFSRIVLGYSGYIAESSRGVHHPDLQAGLLEVRPRMFR